MHITIAIITFKRPGLLQETLRSLADISVPDLITLDVLVVDNDCAQSAKDAAGGAARYAVEPREGRGFARNRALDEARGDWLIFLDDDMKVGKDWLVRLVQAAAELGAQMVAGRVIHLLPDTAPGWARECRIFAPRRAETGAALTSANTGSLLIDRAWVTRKGLRFPPQAFGEDTVFTHEAVRLGATIVYCAEAVTTTAVTAESLTLRWLVWRTVCNGFVRSRLQGQKPAPALRRALKMGIYAPTALVAALFGRNHWIRGVEHAGVSLGWFAGIAGQLRPGKRA